ncbi:MAG: hypothetical protein IJ890_05710 [Clostridia bacterium]|nr:hypothetical protein [Clostridia bacterium]
MKRIILWFFRYLMKRVTISCVTGYIEYDVDRVWFYKEQLVLGLKNRRVINIEEKGDKGGKDRNIRTK